MSASNSPAARAERRGWTVELGSRGACFSVGGYRASDIGARGVSAARSGGTKGRQGDSDAPGSSFGE